MKQVLFSSLVLVITVGCGGGPGDLPELADVSGKVTVGGQPLAKALVEFRPTGSGRPSAGKTAEDGTYTLQYTVEYSGAIVGEHSVVVSLIPEDGDYEAEEDDDADTGLPPEAADGSLKKKVEAGSNTIDIAL